MTISLTRRLPPDAPLLIGRLVFTPARRGSPAVLTLRCWCPYCRRSHIHGWPEPDRPLTALVHRASHCDGGPLYLGGYWITPDPALTGPNRKAQDEYRQALASASGAPTEIVP